MISHVGSLPFLHCIGIIYFGGITMIEEPIGTGSETMAKPLDPELKEQIRTHLASSDNVRKTARQFSVAPSTVLKIRDERPDEFEQLRTDKKQQIISKSWRLMEQFLEAMEAKIPDAGLKDVATSYGIVGDKLLLMTGEPTSRSDNNNKNTHELGELTAEQAEALIQTYIGGRA